nr:MAG: ORF1 [TTV-like mini virus]
MPWYNRWRPYYRRKYRRFWRGPRKTFRRRRFWRRKWVRRKNFFKRKLLKLRLTQWQPKCIRKCKIIGLLCLFQTNEHRISNNFDMYETSWVPERLPGGGGWGLKNFSLNALFDEHSHLHNIWTRTNNDLSLVRYTGAQLTLFQSEDIDYVFTYSNQLPLVSNLDMYHSMQPSIHMMTHNHITIPSKRTRKWRKPYKKIKIKPPTQLINKWYFQKDLATLPLLMIRASSISLDHYYIGTRSQSTNITIVTLNTGLLKNRNFKIWKPNGYWATTAGTQKVYLYGTNSENLPNQIKVGDLIFLGNTTDNKPGTWYNDPRTSTQTQNEMKNPETAWKHWGNPFYVDYLQNDMKVYQTTMTPSTWLTKLTTNATQPITDVGLTQVFILKGLRYNPYRDTGKNNVIYFKSNWRDQQEWDEPTESDLKSQGYPLWLLCWGYPDYQKKIKKLIRIDEEQILTLKTDTTTPTHSPIVPLGHSFIHGKSPYEDEPNPIDYNKWYPMFQYQQEALNDICLSGPGTPKITPGNTVEAKIKYKFYFKWGGQLPPMSTIENPTEKPTYPTPSNILQTTSLQHPETAPESLLHSFDQRRSTLTKKALQRIQKDWPLTETSLLSTDTTSFTVPTPTTYEETSEESSEEEKEENLYELLLRQRSKQQRLKQRILRTLNALKNLE